MQDSKPEKTEIIANFLGIPALQGAPAPPLATPMDDRNALSLTVTGHVLLYRNFTANGIQGKRAEPGMERGITRKIPFSLRWIFL